MVNWKSPAENLVDQLVLLKSVHFLLGVYCWEWLVSVDFDWQYVSGRRKFRWPMVFYFLNRYFLLFTLVGMSVSVTRTLAGKVNCQALLTFNQVMGNMVIGLVSTNFAIRTMAVWSLRWFTVVPLVILVLGHTTILAALLKTEWNPQSGCIITHTTYTIFSIAFIYSMCLDFILLCLTGYKLHVHMSPIGISGSRLARLIFHDGLVYFIIAFLLNSMAATFLLFNWNQVIPIDAVVPAVFISGIAACRAVRRLANYVFIGTDIYQLSMLQPPHVPRD